MMVLFTRSTGVVKVALGTVSVHQYRLICDLFHLSGPSQRRSNDWRKASVSPPETPPLRRRQGAVTDQNFQSDPQATTVQANRNQAGLGTARIQLSP